MSSLVLNSLAMIMIAVGIFFFFVGALGLIRFPDALTRAHGAAKCDTLGAVLCLLGLALMVGNPWAVIKLLLAAVFLWVTTPTATHAVGRAIWKQTQKERK